MQTVLVVTAVLLAEAALILGIMAVLAKSGGWRTLAKVYAATGPFKGERRNMNWVRVGWVGYNGSMIVGVDSQCLYLAVWPILNFMHPPLSIPWADVSATVAKTFIGSCVSLRFKAAPKVNVEISRRLGKWLKEKSHYAELPE